MNSMVVFHEYYLSQAGTAWREQKPDAFCYKISTVTAYTTNPKDPHVSWMSVMLNPS